MSGTNEKFERWEKMLNSVGTCPKIWKVYEEMKQEIIVLNEDVGMLEREVIETITENVLEKIQK